MNTNFNALLCSFWIVAIAGHVRVAGEHVA